MGARSAGPGWKQYGAGFVPRVRAWPASSRCSPCIAQARRPAFKTLLLSVLITALALCRAVQDAVGIGPNHFDLLLVGSYEDVIVYRAGVECECAFTVLVKRIASRSARREVEYETIYAHGGERNA